MVLKRKNRLLIKGPNGIGKSTFLRLLADGKAKNCFISDDVKVGTWFPSVSGIFLEDVARLFPEAKDISFDEGMTFVKEGKASYLLVQQKGQRKCRYLPLKSPDFNSFVKSQSDTLAKLGRYKVSFLADNVAEEFLQKGDVVFFKRPYTKQEVIESAKSGVPLPPKSTRHHLSVRATRADVPFDWFKLSPEEAQKKFDAEMAERLKNDEIRYYQESSLVLSDAHFRNE